MTALRIETDGAAVVLVIDRSDTVTRLTLAPSEARTLHAGLTHFIPRAEAAQIALSLL